MLPVRERLASAIDSGEDGDTGGLVERIGARFREWRNQSLEEALVDVARGRVDARRLRRVARRRVLRWIPLVEGRCADCDDNGLEPTVKGAVPDRSGAPTRASRVAGACWRARRTRVNRSAVAPWSRRSAPADAGNPVEGVDVPFGIRGWLIAVGGARHRAAAERTGLARFYTDYLWFKDVGFSHTWRGADLGQGRSRR